MRTAPIASHLRTDTGPRRVGWGARVRARWWAARYDRELDSDVTVLPGGALAVHRARIVGPAERHRLAEALASVLDRARRAPHLPSARVPLRRSQIIADEALIEEIVECLRGAHPVRARGVARLRLLLADGTGPLYTMGGGSVAAALRGVSAAL